MNARRHMPLRKRERGLAFVLVLWVVAMLTILLGSFSLIARTENIQARHMFDTTQARYAAEAGLNLAAYELRKADPMLRWIGDGRPAQGSVHVAFAASTRAQVDAFHRAALDAGGRDNGTPGLRPHYHPHYYGAFVLVPDGHNIEAVCHRPSATEA